MILQKIANYFGYTLILTTEYKRCKEAQATLALPPAMPAPKEQFKKNDGRDVNKNYVPRRRKEQGKSTKS